MTNRDKVALKALGKIQGPDYRPQFIESLNNWLTRDHLFTHFWSGDGKTDSVQDKRNNLVIQWEKANGLV